MAFGRGIRTAHLLITSVLIACAPGPAAPVETTPTTAQTPTTLPATTTSTLLATTTLPDAPTTTTGEGEDPGIDAEVLIPETDGPFPAVVLVHGGGWVGGGPSQMRPLAQHLTDAGFLTVNTRYALSAESPGFPGALDDIACAVRFAASHPSSTGEVAVVGHSAGAHLAAVVALSGDVYGEDCPVAGSGVPDSLIGMAGPYDIARLGMLMLPFFGAGPTALPEAWAAGNPQLLTAMNPSLKALLLYGENDGLVEPRFAIDFHDALTESGAESLLEEVEGARHLDLASPAVVGDLILVWLER